MGEGGEEGGQNERAHGRSDGMEMGLCARGLGGWLAGGLFRYDAA